MVTTPLGKPCFKKRLGRTRVKALLEGYPFQISFQIAVNSVKPCMKVWSYFVSPYNLPYTFWSSLNRRELWGFLYSSIKIIPLDADTCATLMSHALHLLHLCCIQFRLQFPISIHDVNRPAYLVMINCVSLTMFYNSSATSHTDVIDILVNFTKFGTLNWFIILYHSTSFWTRKLIN